jgi:hypothetical protein
MKNAINIICIILNCYTGIFLSWPNYSYLHNLLAQPSPLSFISYIPLLSVIAQVLFLINAFGYIKYSSWSWYSTFFQIGISLLLFIPTTYFLIQLGDLLPSVKIIFSILCYLCEILKLIYFLLPSTKKLYGIKQKAG